MKDLKEIWPIKDAMEIIKNNLLEIFKKDESQENKRRTKER